MDDLRQFMVWHEKGGYIHVFATDEKDAIEKFYDSIDSCISHHEKRCSCFGEPTPLDRSKVVRPTRVEEFLPKNRC